MPTVDPSRVRCQTVRPSRAARPPQQVAGIRRRRSSTNTVPLPYQEQHEARIRALQERVQRELERLGLVRGTPRGNDHE
jgi:hypothetical protein